MPDKSSHPEQASETDLTSVNSSSQPAAWFPKIVSVGLLLVLIILVAIVALAFLGPAIGNVYSYTGGSI
jgi:hypothetical protein